MSWSKQQMADEVIALMENETAVNLGIGLPTLVAERMPKDKKIVIQSENGVLGVSGRPTQETVSPSLINAGKETISVSAGASYFDSSLSFGMIRGGHIDYSILGGMEVDSEGSLANWMIPGKKVTGMGGAMDLVNGSKTIIVMMNHHSKQGSSKLVKKCSLPLTGKSVVDIVVTDCGVFKIENGQFKILKLADNILKNDLGENYLFS